MTSEQDDGGMGTERIGSTLPETSVKSSASEAESSEGENSSEGAASEAVPTSPEDEASGEAPLPRGAEWP